SDLGKIIAQSQNAFGNLYTMLMDFFRHGGTMAQRIPAHRRSKKTFYEIIEPWLFLLPALAVFIIFLYYPFFKTIHLSTYLTDRNGVAKVFYGLKNYQDVLLGKYS